MFGQLAKAVARATNNSLKDDYVEATAQRLQKVVDEYEGDQNPSPEALFDFEDYIDAATQYTIKSRKASPEEIKEFQRLQKSVDPNQYYRQRIAVALDDTRSLSRLVDVNDDLSKVLPENIRPLARVSGDVLLERTRNEKLIPSVTDEAKERIGSSVLKELLNEEEYRTIIESIARRLPENQTTGEAYVSATQRAQNMEDFTRNSVEKKPQFRSISSYHDLPYDISFAYPREMGTHVGTLGQATGIAVKGINPYSDVGRYLDSRLKPMQPRESEEFFKNQKFVDVKEEMSSKDLKTIRASKPVMMSKGYIDVRKPLVLDFDVKDWSPDSFLIDESTEIYNAIVNQSSGPIPQFKEEFQSLIARAEEIAQRRGNFYVSSEDYKESLKFSLDQTKLNFDFQRFLQKNGFDSIRYRNEVEASLVGEPKYSYVLFRPEQFKSTTAKSFDKEDPRFAFNEGGPVERRGGLIPANIKALVSDLLGLDSPITEEFLSEDEFQSLVEIARRAKEAGKDVIEYADYKTESTGQSQYADIGGGGDNLDFLKKVFNPSYSMKTTLGQARIEEDEDGNTIIRDRYNFNDAGQDTNIIDFAKGVKNAGAEFYPQVRNLGRHFGSGPGEGSEVVINLGRLTPREQRKLANSMSSGS